jgi:hypothetical protein
VEKLDIFMPVVDRFDLLEQSVAANCDVDRFIYLFISLLETKEINPSDWR